MGGPTTNPFADLLVNFNARKADYIRRLTTDEATFERDPVQNGTSKRRGFRRNPDPNQPIGQRPSCSLQDQDAAGLAASNNLALWTDTPCLRAGIGDLWDGEDVNVVVCRLIQFPDPTTFQNNLVIPAEPPDEQKTDLRFRDLLLLLRQLGVTNHGAFRGTIRSLLAMARDDHPDWPDGNLAPTFPVTLIEQVGETFQLDGDPDPADKTKHDDMVSLLAPLRIEGTTTPIGPVLARSVIDGLYAVIRSDLVIGLVQAAAANGRPGPYVVRYKPGEYEPPPNTYEKPPSTYEPPPSTYEKPPSTYEPPNSTYESPNPPPPPPRGQDMLFGSAWNALQVLGQLGRFQLDKVTVRQTALWVSRWLFGGGLGGPIDLNPFDRPGTQLIQAIFGDRWTPQGFVWPDYTRAGMYWWRGIIKHHLTEHIFPLEDTSDFHTTDLIRFLNLFKPDDPRIPSYVRPDILLGLQWFKYWFDEPAATKPDGSARDEMTFWSENHQIGFASSQVLAGKLLRTSEFPRSGTSPTTNQARTGQDHVREGLTRAERWLDHRLQFGFSEWNAPGYYNEDFPTLFNLVDFLDPSDPDAVDQDERDAQKRVKTKAAMAVDVLIFDLARFTCRGSFGVTAGRAYWEHKAYGWEQSVGNTIEILFATRGDYDGEENTAISFATSTYDVPEALLAIGLDRVLLDRDTPFIDRTRVSITFDEASDWQIGFDTEDDASFWWANEAYFDHLLETTKKVVDAHDNLRLTAPFKLLYPLTDGWLKQFVIDLISAALDSIQAAAGVALAIALPFPLNIAVIAFDGKNIIDGFINFFKDLWDALKTVGKAILKFLGFHEDDRPKIPDTAIQQVLEELLVTFNKGTVLTRANICCYCNGDAMLSSVQNHLPGLTAFQKHPWQATLGLEACVWTTARFMSPDFGSFVAGAARFIGELAQLKIQNAVGDLLAPSALKIFTDGNPFGHDGPNYWTGSLALPMIVQHENAAIIAYSIPDEQRNFSGAKTHAWFPKAMFDETSKQNASDGTWFFGRKDSVDSRTGERLGSGYVALFSAREADWTNETGNAWNDKEIMTNGASNIWVCLVGNEHDFGSFDSFKNETVASHLNISGVGSLNPLECSFDIPGAKSPAGTSPRLELFYSTKTGRFAGQDLELDGFPRYENRYIQQTTATPPAGSGVRPQVERFATSNAVGFGSRAYTIVHAPTGLRLEHDLDAPSRSHTSQLDAMIATMQKELRLQDGSLTTVRRSRLRGSGIPPISLPSGPNRRRFS